MRKLSPSGGIKTEVHAPGFYYLLRKYYFMRAAARQRRHREYRLFRQSLKRLQCRRFFSRCLKLSDVFFSLFLISRAFPAKMRKLFTQFDGFARFYKKILLQK